MELSIFQRIEVFNGERGLLDDGYNHVLETLMLNEELGELLEASNMDERVDALCDIIVVAVGSLVKAGYSPQLAMDETLKEIESRTGAINPETGKWQKVTRGDEYKADYAKAFKGYGLS